MGDRGMERGALFTSLEPRPKPETTSPFIRRGKGASGPASAPMMVGRGVLILKCDIVQVCRCSA